ncbi:hypothetical protein CWI38_0293p0050 [Hamiltosporidium tvaerminnensis]|uniref:Uncharacterized protein n=1 Tax=Hamiltosporidium tvaerminnensis TaxID=1176355 RepID=A0A4V2JY14_9MICR|nr:hypothetical protein CWI38_0293p0050 [Hamiltosporidium tvaerminnensis]
MKKGSEVQKNMISLIFYILNFKMIEIWLSSIEQIPVLDFILSLSVGFCEAVILEITEINSSFIDFLNECSFFKNVKKILIFGGSVSNDFNLNSVHLPNLETLSLFMKNGIMESDKFIKQLKMVTEAEIKDSKFSTEETPIDNKEEKHLAESDKYLAFTISNPSNTTKFDIYLPCIYNHFAYNIFCLLLNNNFVDILRLEIKNLKIETLDSLKTFRNVKINLMCVSDSHINTSIYEKILQLNFLEILAFNNTIIIFEKNNLVIDSNTSISVFQFMSDKVLLPKNFLTLINVMKNLETLKIEVCDLQFLPIFTNITDVPKKF